MIEIDIAIRVTTAVIALFALIYGIIWSFKHKEHWFFASPVVILLIHTLVFYGFLLHRFFTGIEQEPVLGISAATFDSTWSAILRLQSITTFFFILIIAGACIKTLPKGNKWTQPKV